MEIYVYETSSGLIADFRPYLDGKDNSFEPARALRGNDARWEKILNTDDPRTDARLWGNIKFVGMGAIEDYHELMIFQAPYEGDIEQRDADDGGEEEAGTAE